MPCVHILFNQLQRRTINSVFVEDIMQQFTQFFWLQGTLFHTGNSRPPNYKAMTSSAAGVAWACPDCSMHRWQHAPTHVDCEGPFNAACSFNFDLLCAAWAQIPVSWKGPETWNLTLNPVAPYNVIISWSVIMPENVINLHFTWSKM